MKKILLLSTLISLLFLTSCEYTRVILIKKYDYADNIRPYPIKDTTECAIAFRKLDDTTIYYSKDYDCSVNSYFTENDTMLIYIKNRKSKK